MRIVPTGQRGSVLIAVVGVLMLLAVMAAAFLSAARQDRTAAGLHATNTQADLLMDGLLNGVKAQLVRDADAPFDAPRFTPWLASRTPTTLDPNAVFDANATNAGPNRAAWPAVSGPVLGDAAYETPYRLPGQPSTRFTINGPAIPTFATYAGGDVPALVVNTAAVGQPPDYHAVPAADADGDGIADAALFRLPVGDLNGIRYFGAVRVIDNNAAVNLDTALGRDADSVARGLPPAAERRLAGAFAAHVGLDTLLRSPEELAALNRYRWNTAPGVGPDGVAGNPPGTAFVFDDTPLAGGVAGPRGDVAAGRPEFQFATLGDFAQSQLARRTDRPGVTHAAGQVRARSTFVGAIDLASRFALAGGTSNAVLGPLAASIDHGGDRVAPARPYTRADGIDAWFRTHFDTLAEDPADPRTHRARRTILTGRNGVSTRSRAGVLPPALLYDASAPEWSTRLAAAYPSGGGPTPAVPMRVAPARGATPDAGPKVSVNAGRFEDLFYAYFKVMARPGFDGGANDAGTPFPAASPIDADPYRGTHFVPATSVDALDVDVAETHPQRMFRSPLRPPRAGPAWDAATPRLPADQVLLLRAALTAANLEALRDSSHASNFVNAMTGTNAGGGNDRTAEHRVPLTVLIAGRPTPVVARVYGLRRQPFIAEIYADARVGPGRANPRGYVAVKLYNPTPVPIGLEHCRLVGLRRTRSTGYENDSPGEYPAMRVRPLVPMSPGDSGDTDQIDLGNPAVRSNVLGAIFPPAVVPAFGTLVLENLPAAGVPATATAAEDATRRPLGSGLVTADGDDAGPITPADFLTQNVAYVPGLSRVTWDRDLVLLRPTNARPPSPAGTPTNTLVYAVADPDAPPTTNVAGMVPLDGYDFTGLTPVAGVAGETWYYARPLAASGGPGDWQFVYPGRYDAGQPIGRPRQQGTTRTIGPPTAVAALGRPATFGTAGTYPGRFTLRLDAFDAPGRSPLADYAVAGPNLFPFGGLARPGELAYVPFVGSYVLQTEADAAAGRDVFLEITPVTLDSVFAEDTDTADDERPGDTRTQFREQLGRFVPVHGVDDTGDASAHRYAFARTLFDHFAVQTPCDDGIPDYPAQPAWRPRTAYSVGDVVQYGRHVYVCRTAHTSGANAAAATGAPDWLDAAAARPSLPASAPVATVNWLPLPRYALANGYGPAGDRGDLNPVAAGNPRPDDFFTANDDFERDRLVPGLINLNTAPEKVLAALPWTNGDALTVRFETHPPTVAAGGDGIDDAAQIAHMIVLYRDGRPAAMAVAAANALGTGRSPSTWPPADEPFGSPFDLYKVPGLAEAQALVPPTAADAAEFRPTRLLDRVSALLTTRSDSFTVYAELQGWRGVGTDRPTLVVRRRAAGIFERAGSAVTVTRVPTQ